MNMSPYNVLVVASLVQREAKPQDFAKVARVIYNRLAEHRKLEFDSTVNYPLDRREVATTDGDRAQATPWNTYAADGLPATPICSPGTDALTAAEHPEDGDWLTSSPSTRRAPRCSPATINSTWPTSNWPSATVCSTVPASRAPKKAAVLGSPIAHSRSPQLHLAAYRALGLDGWTYERIECDADELPGLVSGLGPDWVGVSVTMPGKFAALRLPTNIPAGPNKSDRPTRWCGPHMVGGRTTPMSTASWVHWVLRPELRWSPARAAPHQQ